LTYNTVATPIKLTVQPKGTNQVELTFGPVTPDVLYEVLVRTNVQDGRWESFTGIFIGNSNKIITATCDLNGIQGLTLKTLKNWKFVVGIGEDSDGNEISDVREDLIARDDPYSGIDPNGNLMGDGWSNIQKLQWNWDPFKWYQPPKPVFDVKFYEGTNNNRFGRVVLTMQPLYGTIPDYFLIERANRTFRPMTNDLRFAHLPFGTNRPPNFRPMYGRPDWRHEDPLVTGPFEVVARISGQPGVRDYRYVETNVDTLFQPLYRIQTHYPPPPLHARLAQVNAAAIRKTILPVAERQTTNGYELTVSHPIPYSWYLLLVRDKDNPQWRASGYFASDTNRNPVYLHVDKKGMMSDGQSPIAMPQVKFLPDVVKPEFTAGWGEDSDGDGLPDIYEVRPALF
jgi:hypothetical protein